MQRFIPLTHSLPPLFIQPIDSSFDTSTVVEYATRSNIGPISGVSGSTCSVLDNGCCVVRHNVINEIICHFHSPPSANILNYGTDTGVKEMMTEG